MTHEHQNRSKTWKTGVNSLFNGVRLHSVYYYSTPIYTIEKFNE